MARKNSQYSEAFKENGNLFGLATAAAVSAALLNPLPLLAGLIGEAAYLLFVPDSRWYQSRLSHRHDAEVELRRQQLRVETFALLDANTQERFLRLEQIRQQITTQTQDDQKWFLEVLRRLDYLLEKFLLFAAKEIEFRRYLGTVWQQECAGRHSQPEKFPLARSKNIMRSFEIPSEEAGAVPSAKRVSQMVSEVQASYETEIADLTRLLVSEQDENSKAVLQKRSQVLQQRSEGVGKIGRILTNLQYQLALLEDTFGLINDQIRARSPEQVLADIEGVVTQTDSMTQLLEEIAPYEHLDRD